MGSGQDAFEYTSPRPVNQKKKPPLCQSKTLHINMYEPSPLELNVESNRDTDENQH